MSQYEFVEKPFPDAAREAVELGGGEVVGCWVSARRPNVVAVLVSNEPIDGLTVRHASVSASTMGNRRPPTKKEVRAALKHCGMWEHAARELMGDIVHAYMV